MKKTITIIALLMTLFSSANAQTYTTTDASNWTITNPNGGTNPALVQTPDSAWNNSLGLGWIGVVPIGSTNVPAGTYLYTLTFSGVQGVTDFTTSFVVDNFVTGILLNGFLVDSGGSNDLLSVTNRSFSGNTVSGINELTYLVNNTSSSGVNPSGLTATVTIVSPIPEPSSTALLGLGVLGLFIRRKR